MKKILILLLTIILLVSLVGRGSEKVDITSGIPKLEEKNDTYEEMKNHDKIAGKADKNFLEITTSKPATVRESKKDSTKKITISKNVQAEEYAISYKDLYMGKGDVHYIINFNYKTTTKINYSSGLLYVTVTEYVDKEEHHINDIGSGMILGDFIIYPDGDIEDI